MANPLTNLIVEAIIATVATRLKIRVVDHASVLSFLENTNEPDAAAIVEIISSSKWNAIAALLGRIQVTESDMTKARQLLTLLEGGKKWVVCKVPRKDNTADNVLFLQQSGKFAKEKGAVRIFASEAEAITWIQDEGEKQGWRFASGVHVDDKFEYYQDFLDGANESLPAQDPNFKREFGSGGMIQQICKKCGTSAERTMKKDAIHLSCPKCGQKGKLPRLDAADESLNEEALPSTIKVKSENWVSDKPEIVKYNEKTGRFSLRDMIFTLEPEKSDDIEFELYTIRGDEWGDTYKLGAVSKRNPSAGANGQATGWSKAKSMLYDRVYTASGSAGIEREDENKFAAAAKLLMNIV